MGGPRTIPGDWYPGTIPENAIVDESAYVQTSYSFHRCRSRQPVGVRIGRGASSYLGTMFDVGPHGRVNVGDYAMLNGVWIICDAAVEIGDYALISWNVVLMDTYRVPLDPAGRRRELEEAAQRQPRRLEAAEAARDARPICIGRNVWIGFDVCVLPGVTIGEGAVVGARSVVTKDVDPYMIVAGNPARAIRNLPRE